MTHIGPLSKDQEERQKLLEATVHTWVTDDAEALPPGEVSHEPAEGDTEAPLDEAPGQGGDAVEGAVGEVSQEPAGGDAEAPLDEAPGQGGDAGEGAVGEVPQELAGEDAEAPLESSPMFRETTQILNRFHQAINELSPRSKTSSQRILNHRLQLAANQALHQVAAAKEVAVASARAADAPRASRVLVSPSYKGKQANKRRLDKVDKGIQKNPRKRKVPRRRFETVSELHAQELAAAASSQLQEEALVDGNVHMVNQLKGDRRFHNTKKHGLVARYLTQYETGVTEWASTEELTGHGSR